MSLALVEPTPPDEHPNAAAIQAQLPLDVWDLRVFGYSGDYEERHARFRGRTDRAKRGSTDISQPWLLSVAKEWVFRAALRQISAKYIADVLMTLALLSGTLRERPAGGMRQGRLDRDDVTAHLIRLGHLREAGLMTTKGQQRCVRFLARVLEDARAWGLTDPGAAAHGLPGGFAVRRSDLPTGTVRGVDEPSHGLPRLVVRQLLAPDALALLERGSGRGAVNWFRLALGTGRRPGELTALPAQGCLDFNVFRDEHGVERSHAVLVHDMPKVGIVGYRLPIPSDVAAVVEEQRDWVLSRYPDTDPQLLPLFPAVHNNPNGRRPVPTARIALEMRQWVQELPELRGPDVDEDGRAGGVEAAGGGRDFPRERVYPYALRHTWAQEHADAGTPLEVLQDLMGHRKPDTTRVYFRLTHARRRDAVTRLSQLQLASTGSLVAAGLRVLQPEEGLRGEVGSVAVPFGMCVEPSNVQAGGHSCPFRMRCVGCAHFRTDPSYLPDLNEYLAQLLVSRERLLATKELEPWARESAMPSDAEVKRVRHLIRRCEKELESLTPAERDEIERCIAVVRGGRAGATQAVPLQLLGIVRLNEPDIFPASFERLRADAGTPGTRVAR